MAKKKNSDESIAGSPLLSKELDGNSPSRMYSQIHPDRFDMSKFSEMKEEEESSMRIVIYVVVVIVIGVGLAFLVRYLLTNQQPTTGDVVNPKQEVAITPTPETKDGSLSIATTILSDSAATNPKSLATDFVDTASLSLGTEASANSQVKLTEIKFQKYQSFARLDLKFEGLTNTSNLPISKLDFLNNVLSLKLNDSITIPSGFDSKTVVNDIVTSIGVNGKTIEFTLKEPVKYSVSNNKQSLIFDIKTIAQVEAMSKVKEVTETKDSTTTPADTKTETAEVEQSTSKKNSFSDSKQTVTSGVKENSIVFNEVYYEDILGETDDKKLITYFELAWGSRNNVGSNFIPNATAELIEENQKNFIKVQIKNLSAFAFKSISAGELPIDTAGINFVKAETTEFDEKTGTATVLIELKNKADFRIISEPTVTGQTQVLSVQILD